MKNHQKHLWEAFPCHPAFPEAGFSACSFPCCLPWCPCSKKPPHGAVPYLTLGVLTNCHFPPISIFKTTTFVSANCSPRKIAAMDWNETKIRCIWGSTCISALSAPVSPRGTTSSASFSLSCEEKTARHCLRCKFDCDFLFLSHLKIITSHRSCTTTKKTYCELKVESRIYRTRQCFYSYSEASSCSSLMSLKPDMTCCYCHPFSEPIWWVLCSQTPFCMSFISDVICLLESAQDLSGVLLILLLVSRLIVLHCYLLLPQSQWLSVLPLCSAVLSLNLCVEWSSKWGWVWIIRESVPLLNIHERLSAFSGFQIQDSSISICNLNIYFFHVCH